MSTAAGAPVVVGVDGSEHQRLAVEWAVSEARLRHRPLVLVHAYDTAALGMWFSASRHGQAHEDLRRQAGRLADDALAQVRTATPDVPVSTQVVPGTPGWVLVEASRAAALVVVGQHGGGGFSTLLTGSVAAQVAAHAARPVVVVPAPSGEGPHAGRVVVGVDDSPHSAGVLELAFLEASLRRLGMTAVHAWTQPVSSGPGDMLPLVYDVDDVQAEETRVLDEALAGWRDRYPDVEVRTLVPRDRPAHALVAAAAGAALLVVGARGRGGFPGLRLGSVSRAAVHHPPCPVAVVH